MPEARAIRQIGRAHAGADVSAEQRHQVGARAWFEVYQTERVSLTSVLFSGDDWRWRFRSALGAILVSSEGYRTERACRAAVTALKDFAGSAQVTEEARC